MDTSKAYLFVKLSHCHSKCIWYDLLHHNCRTKQTDIADIPSKLKQHQSEQEAIRYQYTWCTLTSRLCMRSKPQWVENHKTKATHSKTQQGNGHKVRATNSNSQRVEAHKVRAMQSTCA